MSIRYTLGALAALTLAACNDKAQVTDPAPTPSVSRSGDAQDNDHRFRLDGAVYVMTNAAEGNEIIAFPRASNGTLASPTPFATGGRGSGLPRLASQGSILRSDDGRRLFVANVGSNDVSVFTIQEHGLTLVDRVASGGMQPFSLAQRGRVLYVLNEGRASAGSPANVTAFAIGNSGALTPRAGWTRPLSSPNPDPAQLGFSPDGRTLVVTEKATKIIDTYGVRANGELTQPTAHVSNGVTPFGFAFTGDGTLLVSEAFDGAIGQAAASSYSVRGDFHVISPSVQDTQSEVCWATITLDSKYLYITNFGSGTISSYRVHGNGSITLLEPVAGRTAAGLGPRDEDLSRDGRYLYVLEIGFTDPATQSVNAFRVHRDGTLTKIAAYPFPRFFRNVAGLVAR